jgi:hypothetical protein
VATRVRSKTAAIAPLEVCLVSERAIDVPTQLLYLTEQIALRAGPHGGQMIGGRVGQR